MKKIYYLDLKKPLEDRIKFKNQNKTAEYIGITPTSLSRIMSGKTATTKMTAYCIVKAFNKEAEIEDYFVREEE